MAAERWNRDLILANYQAASANEDIESCITNLENNSWDLQAALNYHFLALENENHQEQQGRRSPSPIDVDLPPFIDLDPDPLMRHNLDGQSPAQPKNLKFKILWQERTIPLSAPDTDTVGSLRRMLEIQTGMSQDAFNLEGWPSGDLQIHDQIQLSSLNLSEETHLVLHIPAKVTVSPAEYKPCNIPACRTPTERHSDSPDSPPRIINVQIDNKPEIQQYDVTLNVNYEGRDYRLKYKPSQSVKEVKQELHLLTKIGTRYQEWTGWPPGTTNLSKLGDLQLSPHHFLLLSSQPPQHPQPSTSSREYIEFDVAPPKHPDSGMAGSPEDTDVEEHIISDDDETIFDADASQSKRIIPLISRNASDSSETIIKLQSQFEERYGDFHPVFFMGPLKDAIEEAAGPSVDQRRPLLVYLHHDGSILTNIFCSQILCSEQVVSYISQNFVIWPWDMTFESNRQRFVNMLVQHFGNAAANSISKFRDGEYPLLLIVMKSKAGLEVCSVLQANTSLDELMMALISGYEVFEQTKSIEVKAEYERLERERMKLEQDAAYEESLAADRAKAEAEKSRAKQEYEEQKQAQLNAQIKEAERISCEEQLPEEPPKSAKNATNIVFRFPYGEREARRFHNHDTLRVVFMYVASKGFSLEEHRIVTNFPRKELKQDSMFLSLKELDLCPQQTLFVEEI